MNKLQYEEAYEEAPPGDEGGGTLVFGTPDFGALRALAEQHGVDIGHLWRRFHEWDGLLPFPAIESAEEGQFICTVFETWGIARLVRGPT